MPSHLFKDIHRQECYNPDPYYRYGEYTLVFPLLPPVHESPSHSPAVFQHFRGDHFLQDKIADTDDEKIIQLADEEDGIGYQINGRKNVADWNQDNDLGVPADPGSLRASEKAMNSMRTFLISFFVCSMSFIEQ